MRLAAAFFLCLFWSTATTAATCNNWWMENHPSSGINAWFPGCLPTSSDVSNWNGYGTSISTHSSTLSSHGSTISSHTSQLSTVNSTLTSLQDQIDALESSEGGGTVMGMTLAEGVEALILIGWVFLFASGFIGGFLAARGSM